MSNFLKILSQTTQDILKQRRSILDGQSSKKLSNQLRDHQSCMLGDRNQGEVQQDQGFEMRVQLYLYSNKATGLDITPELPLYIKEKSPPSGRVPLPPSIPPSSHDYHSQSAVYYQQACQ